MGHELSGSEDEKVISSHYKYLIPHQQRQTSYTTQNCVLNYELCVGVMPGVRKNVRYE